MPNSEVEIPMAREIPITIVVAEPIIVETTRLKWKCKIPFCASIGALCLAVFAFLMFVFWNQARH